MYRDLSGSSRILIIDLHKSSIAVYIGFKRWDWSLFKIANRKCSGYLRDTFSEIEQRGQVTWLE